MTIQEVPLSAIDFNDETFRITEDLDLPRMSASLQAVGQLNPVTLQQGAAPSGYRILCGFRRLHALRFLGREAAVAGIRQPAESGPLQDFLIAVWDNLAHRQLGPLEVARVLRTLRHHCGIEEETLVERFLPLLGVSAHRNVLRSCLKLHDLCPGLRCLLSAGHLTQASAERLARTSPETQARLMPVLSRIRLSASLQREVLELAEDLAAISATTLEEVLDQPEILAIADAAGLSAFQKGEKVHALLYQQRNPRLTGVRATFLAEKTQLNLPGTIRLSPDPFFESPRLRVEFEAGSAQAFREAVDALARACRDSSLDRLFRIL
jgi:ParB-like chromosome segregation protein Spo0J